MATRSEVKAIKSISELLFMDYDLHSLDEKMEWAYTIAHRIIHFPSVVEIINQMLGLNIHVQERVEGYEARKTLMVDYKKAQPISAGTFEENVCNVRGTSQDTLEWWFAAYKMIRSARNADERKMSVEYLKHHAPKLEKAKP